MDEILFRGKKQVMSLTPHKIATGEWAYGYYVHAVIDEDFKVTWCDMIISDKNFALRSIIDVRTVGQYTGLTDKNGTKIFEGDIVKCSDGENYQVVFEQRNNCAYFGLAVTSNDTWVFDDGANYILKVIGNIYDNPELLSGRYRTHFERG